MSNSAGKTFKRSSVETRGQKKLLSPQNLKAMDDARTRLVAKAGCLDRGLRSRRAARGVCQCEICAGVCGVSSVGVGGPGLAMRSKAAQADSEYEVHWPHVIRAARMPKVDPTTASKNMRAAGYDVKWRAPRLKPARGEADEKERKRVCNVLRKLPVRYWLEGPTSTWTTDSGTSRAR